MCSQGEGRCECAARTSPCGTASLQEALREVREHAAHARVGQDARIPLDHSRSRPVPSSPAARTLATSPDAAASLRMMQGSGAHALREAQRLGKLRLRPQYGRSAARRQRAQAAAATPGRTTRTPPARAPRRLDDRERAAPRARRRRRPSARRSPAARSRPGPRASVGTRSPAKRGAEPAPGVERRDLRERPRRDRARARRSSDRASSRG